MRCLSILHRKLQDTGYVPRPTQQTLPAQGSGGPSPVLMLTLILAVIILVLCLVLLIKRYRFRNVRTRLVVVIDAGDVRTGLTDIEMEKHTVVSFYDSSAANLNSDSTHRSAFGAALQQLPFMHRKQTEQSQCAICLQDYEQGEELRCLVSKDLKPLLPMRSRR